MKRNMDAESLAEAENILHVSRISAKWLRQERQPLGGWGNEDGQTVIGEKTKGVVLADKLDCRYAEHTLELQERLRGSAL